MWPFGTITITAEEDYEGSLSELVENTTRHIEKHIKNEAAHYIVTMARRATIALKAEATILQYVRLLSPNLPLIRYDPVWVEKVSLGQTNMSGTENGC